VFAAVYNYAVSDCDGEQVPHTFLYGPSSSSTNQRAATLIPARYSPRPSHTAPPKPTKLPYAGENFHIFHGLDPATKKPDWLAEIFEWLSSGHERAITARDSVGRIPDSAMIFNTADVPAWKPQAALHMAWLQQVVQRQENTGVLPSAPSPMTDAEHLVICSHDVDYYYTTRASAYLRLLKNLGIAALVYKSWTYFFANSKLILDLLRGGRPGDYLLPLLERLKRTGAGTTLFVVPVHTHRRDPDYALADLAPLLQDAVHRGFSVEIHGSYQSIIENRSVLSEAQILEEFIASKPRGSRQHWLRFDSSEHLFAAVEAAGLVFDSSMGFTSNVGFRNGACFAFPPYDFKHERAHNFLEIPLAIMDGSLVDNSRASSHSPQFLADRVLNESRKRGWGGISILWHNPVEALSVPPAINQVFWNCAGAHQQFAEKWVSTDQFLSLCLPRYQNAGLLKGFQLEDSSLSHS
jgi:hypothetical protein